MPKAINTKAASADTPLKIETPLADSNGDTTPVSSSLGFVATVLRNVDPSEGLTLSYNDCCGLSYLLDTCAAALDAMNCPDLLKGGAQ